MSTSDLLAACWERWAMDLSALLDAHWRLPTRRAHWDVLALATHAAPDLTVLRDGDAADASDAVTDAGRLLHDHDGLPQPDAIEPVELRARFAEAARWLRTAAPDPGSALVHPTVGPVTVHALLEAALADTVVHHDDLREVVTRPAVPEEAERAVADLLG